MTGSHVKRPYVRSAVRAEVRRALRDGRAIDRQYLRDETGLSWNRLERLIAEARMDLDAKESAVSPPVVGGGGAKATDDVSPTNGPARPFAPPTSGRKGKP